MRTTLQTKITEVKNKSGTSSYRVFLGQFNKKRQYKQFSKIEEAKVFCEQVNLERKSEHYKQLVGDLGELMMQRHQLLHLNQKLKSAGSTFAEAVEYYLTYAKPQNGNITIGEAIQRFLRTKRNSGKSEKYLSSIERFDFKVFQNHFGKDTFMSEISIDKFNEYLYSFKTWNNVSKLSHIRFITTLFNFCLKNGHITKNPINEVERPNHEVKCPEILTVSDTRQLLQTALDRKMYDRLAICVLVGFVGSRIEEATKLTWENIDWDNRLMKIPHTAAKKYRFRNNRIPNNAMEWLYHCRPKDYRTSKKNIIDSSWRWKLSYLIKISGIKYHQNALRRSFASYFLELSKNPDETGVVLGHVEGNNTLYKFYRNVVVNKDAISYFNIFPKKLRRVTGDIESKGFYDKNGKRINQST